MEGSPRKDLTPLTQYIFNFKALGRRARVGISSHSGARASKEKNDTVRKKKKEKGEKKVIHLESIVRYNHVQTEGSKFLCESPENGFAWRTPVLRPALRSFESRIIAI